MIKGLNHVTLAVSDLDKSVFFYKKALGFCVKYRWSEGAYLGAGDLWLCLSLDSSVENEPRKDYTHFAFDVSHEQFEDVKFELETLEVRQWKDNKSEGKSIYFLDPDGHKLELHIGTMETRIAAMKHHNQMLDVNTHPAMERLRKLKPKFQDMNISRMRVFGSVVRGEAGPNSDIDLLVDFIKTPGWGYGDLQNDLERELLTPVDIVTEGGLKDPIKQKILSEAQDV